MGWEGGGVGEGNVPAGSEDLGIGLRRLGGDGVSTGAPHPAPPTLRRDGGHEVHRPSRSRGPRRRFTQRGCPVSPASISAAAGRNASRWFRKGGAEPPGHSTVCCVGSGSWRRHRGIRRRSAGPRCWVGPGRLRGGEPERGVQAVHGRCARRSPRARLGGAMSKPRPVCWPAQPKRLISRGWLEPGAAWGSLGNICR